MSFVGTRNVPSRARTELAPTPLRLLDLSSPMPHGQHWCKTGKHVETLHTNWVARTRVFQRHPSETLWSVVLGPPASLSLSLLTAAFGG